MKPIDLTKPLRKYKSGWVALDDKKRVVAYAKTFADLMKKVKENPGIFAVPASNNYFGFVTNTNG
ncbi:hypothetical protein HY468_00655 [Candidatus Roizmanbacteria bacterium]|nr:hypothetical protein [Candidatus Roizmanbacteria bacterium]